VWVVWCMVWIRLTREERNRWVLLIGFIHMWCLSMYVPFMGSGRCSAHACFITTRVDVCVS